MLNRDYKEMLQNLLGNKVKFLIVGAPVGDIDKNSFTKKGIVFQIGAAPRRIDIITHIDGISFRRAYKGKEVIEIDGITAPFISKENLIKNKLSSGRAKDKLDAVELKKAGKGDVSILKR